MKGYKRLEMDFEHGLHGGQDADPRAIAKALRARGVERFIFTLDSVGQFDMDFSVWIHRNEFRKAKLDQSDCKAALDPAVAMQRALASIPPAPPGPGVTVTKLHADGTATTKLVSPRDFIEGRALE